MKKKLRVAKIFLALFLVATLLLSGGIVYMNILLREAEDVTTSYEALLTKNRQYVYVVSTEDGEGIRRGEVIIEGVNVEKTYIYTSQDTSLYLDEDEIGSTALVDLADGMAVLSNMVSAVEIDPDTREYEISVVNLMTDQQENDYVDIRIQFADGSDFLVLSKKRVKNLALEECVFWTYLNEEEILRLSSAVIDAYSVTGTYLYATRYVEENLQEEAEPTYPVNSVVRDMMDTSSTNYDVNLMSVATQTLNETARYNLEARLGSLTSEKLSAVNSGRGTKDTAQSSALLDDTSSPSVTYSSSTSGSFVTDVN